MFRMPRVEDPGQVVDGCSPQQRDHPLHPVILSKKVGSGPVIPSNLEEPNSSRLRRSLEPMALTVIVMVRLMA